MRAGIPLNVARTKNELFWSWAFAIRDRDFQRLGGFSAHYSGYGGGDTDFSFIVRHHRLSVLFANEVVFHQHHGVYKPPLNHFTEILKNATAFQQTWEVWLMEG